MPSKSRPHKHLNRLYSRTITLVDREIEAIDRMGKYGEKLPATAARDLINYTKLLKELMEAADRMKAEQDAAKKKAPMSTEQLEQLARDVTGAGSVVSTAPPSPSKP